MLSPFDVHPPLTCLRSPASWLPARRKLVTPPTALQAEAICVLIAGMSAFFPPPPRAITAPAAAHASEEEKEAAAVAFAEAVAAARPRPAWCLLLFYPYPYP